MGFLGTTIPQLQPPQGTPSPAPSPTPQPSPNVPPAASNAPQPPPDASGALDQVIQTNQQRLQANTPPPIKGGMIRQFLTNFVHGMGQSMQANAGLPTQQQQQQLATTNIINAQNAKANIALHQQMAEQYKPVPLVGLDGKPVTGPDGQPISLPANHAATWYAGQLAAASRVQVQGMKPVVVPGVGAFQGASEGFAPIAGTQGISPPVDHDTAMLAGMPQMEGQPANDKQWSTINKALSARGLRVQDMGVNGTGPNQGMWLIDRAGTPIKQTSPNSLVFQRGASFAQNKPEVVTDPNDPGYAYYTSAANAMRNNLPSPQGAATVASRREASAEVPSKIGDQKVAFTTAIQHSDLLRQAVQALNNGDQQTLNSLENRFSNEFGGTGPITAQAVADAYGREVTSMLSKNHMTDSEIAAVGRTVDPLRQSPQQIGAVINAYQALAKSKLNMLNQQAQSSANRARLRPQTAAPTGGFAAWKARQNQ